MVRATRWSSDNKCASKLAGPIPTLSPSQDTLDTLPFSFLTPDLTPNALDCDAAGAACDPSERPRLSWFLVGSLVGSGRVEFS